MASNFACTPNTKLRKDTEFLGAFAKNFQFTGSVGHAPAKSVTFKSSTTSLKQSSAPKKEPAKNLGVFYKIQGVASLRDEEGRREARQQSELQRQKNKRSQKIMDKRKITDRKSPTPELLAPVNANRNANINLKKLQSTQAQHSVPLANKNSNAISSSRKDQLQRWKDQKTAAEIAARRNIENKRAPVHTNLSHATKQAPGQAMPNKITKNVNIGLARKPPVPQGSTGNCIQGSKPNERRVTRAMAKAQIPGPTVAYVQPAISKMKSLSITTKTHKRPVQPVPEVKVEVTTTNIVNVKTTSGTTRQFENHKLGSSPVEDVIMTTLPEKAQTQDTKEQLSILQTAPHPPAAAPTTAPKKKIMALDKYYIEYNQYLAEACTTLMKNWTLWENKRENDKLIPEDILSEIESTLGQATLLMRSKLPQFVQLLYFYLSNENFPGPVLPCDLQGWWDVASMQVERVTDRFNELCKLEENGWRSTVESRPLVNKVKINKPMKKSSEESSESSSESSGQANSKPAKSTQASLGLRQFLANKRRNALSVDLDLKTDAKNDSQVKISNSASPVKSNNLVYTTPTKSTSSASRQFEGGFFQVTSPLRATNTNSSVCRTPVQSVRENGNKSISRRASVGHNCSLVTLAVRKSMGPMFKIGATTQLTTETEQIESSESSTNANLDSQPMEMYTSFYPPKPKPTQFSKNSCSDFYATEQSKNPSLWGSYLNASNCSHNSSGNSNSTNVSPNTGNIVKTQSFTSVSQLQLLNCLTRNKNYMHQWNNANTDYKLINRQRENGNPEPADFLKSNLRKQRLEIDSANLNALRDCHCQCKHSPYFANSSLTLKEPRHTTVVSTRVASTELRLDVNVTEPSQPDDCRMINLYNHGKKHNYRELNSSTSSDTNNSVSDNRATLTKGQHCARNANETSFQSHRNKNGNDCCFQSDSQNKNPFLIQSHSLHPTHHNHHSRRSHHSTKHRHAILQLKSKKSKCAFSRSFHFMDVITQGDRNHAIQAGNQNEHFWLSNNENINYTLPKCQSTRIKHKKKIAHGNRRPRSTSRPYRIFRNFSTKYTSEKSHNCDCVRSENLTSSSVEPLPYNYANYDDNALNVITHPNRRKRNNPGVIGEGRNPTTSLFNDENEFYSQSPGDKLNSNKYFVNRECQNKYGNEFRYTNYKNEKQSGNYARNFPSITEANPMNLKYAYDQDQNQFSSHDENYFIFFPSSTQKCGSHSNEEEEADDPMAKNISSEYYADMNSQQCTDFNTESFPVPESVDVNADTISVTSWSPFCYNYLNTFNSNELRTELESIFPDWPKEFVVTDEDEELFEANRKFGDGISSDSFNKKSNHSCRYISFFKGDITVGPVSYCDIFGAQNLMDLHPEYSPFNDATNLVQNLIFNHHQHQVTVDVSTPEEPSIHARENDDSGQPRNSYDACPSDVCFDANENNFNHCHSNHMEAKSGGTWNRNQHDNKLSKESQNKWRSDPDPNCFDFSHTNYYTSSNCNQVTQNRDTEEDQKFCDASNFKETLLADKNLDNVLGSMVPEEHFSQSDFQCQVCDIYKTMKRKRNYNYSGASINISAECTNCGRFTDITPRRSTRLSSQVSGDEIDQPMSEAHYPSQRSGSD